MDGWEQDVAKSRPRIIVTGNRGRSFMQITLIFYFALSPKKENPPQLTIEGDFL